MPRQRLPFFLRDCAKRSSWGDYRDLFLFSVEQCNAALLAGFGARQ